MKAFLILLNAGFGVANFVGYVVTDDPWSLAVAGFSTFVAVMVWTWWA